MHIPRLLVLSLLISIGGAPVVAQSSPEKVPFPQLLPIRPQGEQSGIRVDQFRLPQDGINPPNIIRQSQFPVTVLTPEAICYSIRTYRVTRVDPESDVTRSAGSSTCEPATWFGPKDVVISPAQTFRNQ
jgi:hypothetical protein